MTSGNTWQFVAERGGWYWRLKGPDGVVVSQSLQQFEDFSDCIDDAGERGYRGMPTARAEN
jgi:hypothetical protein